MKPELQVCSFQQAKKLYELGILQHSFFCYVFYTPRPDIASLYLNKAAQRLVAHGLRKFGDNAFAEIRSAFNISELALLLNLQEGPLDPIVLADQLILQLMNHHLSIEEVNSRLLSAM